MITGIDVNATQNFISKFDTGDVKTIWKISCLSAREFAYISGIISNEEKAVEGLIEVVRFGLKGFENFGNGISFEVQPRTIGNIEYKIVSDKVMNIIPVDILIELGGRIIEISKLTEQERKN